MSNYPPPPTTSPSDGVASTDVAQQGAEADNHQTNAPTHSLFTTDAAAAAVAAAHHGLQALQAAVAAPAPVPSTGTIPSQQHASIGDASYLTGTNVGQPTAAGANSKPNTNSKATRLRRACDMCSQRKVKVCTSVPVYVRAVPPEC